jgi:UDP-glucose 4-epimerase
MSVYAITGAAGYIGRCLTRRLSREEDCERIVGVDVRTSPHSVPKTKNVCMDVRDPRLSETFRNEGVEIIVHTAWAVRQIHNAAEMRSINMDGMRNMLEAAKRCSARRIVHLSSTTVYGAYEDRTDFLKEESDLRPLKGVVYAEDKAAAEATLAGFKDKHPGVGITILRPCTVIGPSADNLIADMFRKRAALLVRGCNPPYQFVHVDDLAEAVLLAAKQGTDGTYNVVGSGTIQTREMYSLAGQKVLSLPYTLVYALAASLWHLRLPGGLVPPVVINQLRYPWLASGEKAERDLGFVPKYSSREALLDFLQN